jgi:hypothetical protein
VTDQLIGPQAGSRLFPLLHPSPRTLNYRYRGLRGTLAGIITLFAAPSFTRKTDPAKLERLTINWKGGTLSRHIRLALAVCGPDGDHGAAVLAASVGETD